MRFLKILLLSFLIFSTNLFANKNFQIIEEWHNSQTFESKGENSFNIDYLIKNGEEDNFSVKENELNWEIIKSDSNGYVKTTIDSGRQIVYLYSILKSNEAKNLALTVSYTGGLQIWLNNDKKYSNRISRKPVADDDLVLFNLKEGNNLILIKFEGNKSSAGFYFRLYEPEGNIFVNEAKTICPDFRIDHKVKGWGQIEFLNTGQNNISSLEVNIFEDSLIIPFSESVKNINVGEVKKIPFIISTKKEIYTKEKISFKMKLKSESGEKIIDITPIIRTKNNYFVTTYLSKLDGSVQPYSVLLPKTYNPDQKYSLIMLLHGAWVTSWAQNIISYDPKDWAVQVAVHDRGNNRYREIGEVDLNEVMEDVKKHYKINEDEIYLAGHSMGGYGTYFQAVRHPDKWNAISPQAGYTDYFLYAKKEELNTFKKKLFEEWSPLLFAENLLHVPVYIVHGAKDDNVDVKNDREMSARLKELNYDFIYDENPNTGHWWGPRGKNYGVEVVDKPAIWNFLRKNKICEKYPKKIVYKTNTLRYNKAYWITINEMDSIYSMAEVNAEIQGNEINIQLNNIKQIALTLNDSLIDLNNPIKIIINSNHVYNDIIDGARIILNKLNDNDYEIVLPEAISNYDSGSNVNLIDVFDENGKVKKLLIDSEGLKKNNKIFGPVIDVFNSKFLFVIGSEQNNSLSIAIKKCAETIAASWEISSNGNVFIKSDEGLDYKDLIDNNLILFGNAKTNKIIEQINQSLPIHFSKNKIEIGNKILSDQDGFVEIYPSPFNPQKYVVIFGGNVKNNFDNISNYPLEKLPDYVIFNDDSFRSETVNFIEAGFFNKHWKVQ